MLAAELAVQQGMHSLYQDHHSWLQNWLRKKLGNTFDAAEVAQDTFVKVLTAWRQHGDPDLQEPRAYLVTVAGRMLHNHWRRLSLEQAYLATLASLPEAEVASTEEHFLVLEALQEIDCMLERLGSKVRMAFLLAQLEELTYAQIAERLQVNVRTVKRYMVKAYEECLLLMV